jgi:hypothetical protein
MISLTYIQLTIAIGDKVNISISKVKYKDIAL